MDDEILRIEWLQWTPMVGNDFNELSTLSQGRWRGIYTPPQNLTVDAFIAAVVPEVQAVLLENSGTTGPSTGPPFFQTTSSPAPSGTTIAATGKQ